MAKEVGTYKVDERDLVQDYDYAKHSLSENVGVVELLFLRTMTELLFNLNPFRAVRLLRDYPVSRFELFKAGCGLMLQIFVYKPRSWLVGFTASRLGAKEAK